MTRILLPLRQLEELSRAMEHGAYDVGAIAAELERVTRDLGLDAVAAYRLPEASRIKADIGGRAHAVRRAAGELDHLADAPREQILRALWSQGGSIIAAGWTPLRLVRAVFGIAQSRGLSAPKIARGPAARVLPVTLSMGAAGLAVRQLVANPNRRITVTVASPGTSKLKVAVSGSTPGSLQGGMASSGVQGANVRVAPSAAAVPVPTRTSTPAPAAVPHLNAALLNAASALVQEKPEKPLRGRSAENLDYAQAEVKKDDCKPFVNNIIRNVTKGTFTPGGGYSYNLGNSHPSPYHMRRITDIKDVQPGDIMQILNPADQDDFYKGMHTAIVRERFESTGAIPVVDSNGENDGLIRAHTFNAAGAVAKYPDNNLEVWFFRLEQD